MPTQLKADDLGYGMLLSGIESHADANRLQIYFFDNGFGARIESQSDGKYQILIEGISRNSFNWLIAGADVELI